MVVDLSTAILQLSENGDLQRMSDKWLSREGCSGQVNPIDENRLSLKSFWGLFIVCGIACFMALIVFFCRVWWQYTRYNAQEDVVEESGMVRRRSFKEFVDKKEDEIKEIVRKKSGDSMRHGGQGSDEQSS